MVPGFRQGSVVGSSSLPSVRPAGPNDPAASARVARVVRETAGFRLSNTS